MYRLKRIRPRKHKHRMATRVIWGVLDNLGRRQRDRVKHIVCSYPVGVHLVPGMNGHSN
jgi:hypothetical protein